MVGWLAGRTGGGWFVGRLEEQEEDGWLVGLFGRIGG